MNTLEINNLQKKIDKDFVLGPLNTEIEPGSVVALVGSNGSGKSTLFQMIMGLVKHDEGSIKVMNVNAGEPEMKKSTAYLPQSLVVQGKFTMRQLADLNKLAFADWSETIFQEYVQKFGIPLNKRLDKMSGGIQKKAFLAIQLSRSSSLLLLDEPYAGLDFAGQEMLDEEIIKYMERSENQTVLFASHSGDEIKRIADYIWLVHQGRHIGIFEKDELQQNWRRVWIKDSLAIKNDTPGLISVNQADGSLITKNNSQTLESLKKKGIEVLHTQPMDLREILTELLKKEEKGEKLI
ncbi:ATP-binding cassette domain-containing protein [Metabacillus arenae]|uniref:ABC transporter ATP-binding protein n=1 Tax=Metabacillus arenae TaxID=2771434 RepID=A0A926NG34_9BACI|nr:ABC transporter ATP-binding protein [Metabacillus arenae]MBD1380636.1 ABC transporter ATP-binding protein [Metabacillus arenae]